VKLLKLTKKTLFEIIFNYLELYPLELDQNFKIITKFN